MGQVKSIWLKRFHRGPMDEVKRATVLKGRGLSDNADQGGQRQVTIISQEEWTETEKALAVGIAPIKRRANLLVSDIELKNTRNRVLRIGDCRLRIRGETRPCKQMAYAVAGLRTALSQDWRGGVYAEALNSGTIAVGDDANWEDVLLDSTNRD